MKKFLLSLAAALGVLVGPLPAFGDGGPQLSLEQRRLETIEITAPVVNTGTVATAIGLRGSIARAVINTTAFSQTSSVGVLPYPARLGYVLVDGGGADTLVCDRVRICGKDLENIYGCETIAATTTALTETVQYTSKVYRSVSEFSSGAGKCAAGSDATDYAFLFVSDIALPAGLDKASDLLSVCARVQSAGTTQWYCSAGSVCPTYTLGRKNASVRHTSCVVSGFRVDGLPTSVDSIRLMYLGAQR